MRHTTIALALLGMMAFCVSTASAQQTVAPATLAAQATAATYQAPVMLARTYRYKARVGPYAYRYRERYYPAPRYYYRPRYYRVPYVAPYYDYYPSWGYYGSPYGFYYSGPRVSFGFGF